MPDKDGEWSFTPPKGVKPDPKSGQSNTKSGDGKWSFADLPDKSGGYTNPQKTSDYLMGQLADMSTHAAEGVWGAVQTPIHVAGKVMDIMGNTKGPADDWKKVTSLGRELVTDPMQQTRDKGRQLAQSSNRASATMGGVTYAAGMVPIVGPMIGQVTSNLGEGNFGAASGDLLGMYIAGKAPAKIAQGMQKAGEAAYGASLRLTKQGRMKAAQVIKQGVNERVGMDANGLERIQQALKDDADFRDLVTKDKTNPDGYALNTIPLAEVRNEILSKFDKVKQYDKPAYAEVVKIVDRWEKELDRTVPTKQRIPKTFSVAQDMKGITKPVAPKLRVKPKYTNVAAVQDLKEYISTRLRTNSFSPLLKTNEMGMDQWTHVQAETATHDIVQRAIDHMTDGVNKRMHIHMLLRSAVVDAMSRNPSWINDWAIFAAGAGLERVIASMAKSGVPDGLGAGVVAGGLLRAAIRNPRVMSRLGIALNAGGIRLGALAPVFRAASAAHLSTKGQETADPISQEEEQNYVNQYTEPIPEPGQTSEIQPEPSE